MRARRRLTAAGLAISLVLAAESLAAASIIEPVDPEVVVEGVVERLSDRSAEEGTALRLPDGQRLPIDDPGAAQTGDAVAVTLPVPEEIVDAALRGSTVEGLDEPVDLSRGELLAATRSPAPADSALAEASVHAALAGDAVAPVDTIQITSRQQATTTPQRGVNQVWVAVAVPKGVQGTAPTAAEVTNQVRNVGAYWREQSGGTVDIRLAGTTRPYRSAFSCTDNPFDMWTEAARAAGFREGERRHLVVVLPRAATAAGCSYGLASMGTSVATGGIVYVSDTAWPVLAHELGHNFGLAHAQRLRCRTVSDASLSGPPSQCRLEDYGDPYDVMAASSRDNAGSLSTPQAARIGLLGSREVVDVTSPTARVTINAVSSLKGVRAVRIREPGTGEVYWVEYRTRAGRDARLYEPMTAGVRILREERATTENPWPGTVALDASPTGRADDWSWHLPTSHRLTSAAGGVTVSVERTTSTTATVFINTGTGRTVAGARNGQVTRFGRAAAAPPVMRTMSIDARGVASWSATGGSGLRYDVVVRRVNGRSTGPVQTWYSGTTRTTAQLRGTRGTTVQVRARARSADGTVSGWSSWRAVAFR